MSRHWPWKGVREGEGPAPPRNVWEALGRPWVQNDPIWFHLGHFPVPGGSRAKMAPKLFDLVPSELFSGPRRPQSRNGSKMVRFGSI